MSVLDEADAILAKRTREVTNPRPTMQPLPFNICPNDNEYCLYQKRCSICPRRGGNTTNA